MEGCLRSLIYLNVFDDGSTNDLGQIFLIPQCTKSMDAIILNSVSVFVHCLSITFCDHYGIAYEDFVQSSSILRSRDFSPVSMRAAG